ncbi:VWA domain-containing protein [Candidatus Bipolaricaulota bacterium]|nr:VWA domain-containing protein [Candidatus Bipolaricaulota bacterium]
MDVSGSMAWRWKGGIKIDSAKQAALQFIEEVANEPRLPGTSHRIGVVIFSGSGSLVLPLTEDYAHARQVIINLGTASSTNLGAGLVTALQELDKVPTAQRFVILLSDGETNTGLSRQQILSGPVVGARQKRICIHTVAFGDPGDIDEDFLRKIAAGSGCGSYNYAASGFQLFGTYVKIRHAILGSNRIVEFTSETSKGSRVYVLPGQAIALGAFQLTGPARELHYTLAWSEPGRMRAKLVDPSGREVTYTYPGAKLYSGSGFSHITVFSPKQGIWRVAAVGGTTFPRGIEYYGVTSARTGGIVIPYRIPEICIFDDICIPLPDLPTWLIVGISVAALAIVVYSQLVAK